jgi:hypothetical protein
LRLVRVAGILLPAGDEHDPVPGSDPRRAGGGELGARGVEPELVGRVPGESEVSVTERRDTCTVGIAIISAHPTPAPEFVPDKREVHLLRVNPPRCSMAMRLIRLAHDEPSREDRTGIADRDRGGDPLV